MYSFHGLFKSLVLLVLVAGVAGILLFGPRKAANAVTVADDVVVVDYWEKWTGHEGQQMQDIVDEFNRTVGAQKKIFVRYISTSQITQKTLIATAAGVPPDIAGVWDNTMPQLAAMDALEPLDELATAHGISAASYKKVYWDNCVYDGRLLGLVSTPMAVALHVNLKLVHEHTAELRAAGLDPDVPPRTIAELDAWSSALTERSASGGLERAGYLPLEPGWYLLQTPIWFGTDVYDDKTHKFTLTDPRVVQAFEWVQSYSKRVGREALSEFRSGLGNFDSPQNGFLADNVVMVQQGPWMANYIRNLKPSMSGATEPIEDEIKRPLAERLKHYGWAAVPFPSLNPDASPATYCGFDAMVIPRGGKHKQEAFEFIAYVQRQDVHEKLNMAHCKNSALIKVSDNFLNHHPNPYIRVFEDLARSPGARGCVKVPIYSVMSEEMNTLIQQIALMQVEPRDGLQQSQDRLQAKLDQFLERQALRK